MGLFTHFPYTNFHELNLDWILRKIKSFEEKTENLDDFNQTMDNLQQSVNDTNQTIGEIENELDDLGGAVVGILGEVAQLNRSKVPAGGMVGQVLTKNSNDDYDMSWQTPQGGGGGAVVEGDYVCARYLLNLSQTEMNVPFPIAGLFESVIPSQEARLIQFNVCEYTDGIASRNYSYFAAPTYVRAGHAFDRQCYVFRIAQAGGDILPVGAFTIAANGVISFTKLVNYDGGSLDVCVMSTPVATI